MHVPLPVGRRRSLSVPASLVLAVAIALVPFTAPAAKAAPAAPPGRAQPARASAPDQPERLLPDNRPMNAANNVTVANPGTVTSVLGSTVSLQMQAVSNPGDSFTFTTTWPPVYGRLPTGLSISPSGLISGTVTALGSTTVTVTAFDNATGLMGDAVFTWVVEPEPSVSNCTAVLFEGKQLCITVDQQAATGTFFLYGRGWDGYVEVDGPGGELAATPPGRLNAPPRASMSGSHTPNGPGQYCAVDWAYSTGSTYTRQMTVCVNWPGGS
jgi:hypothetical protein